MSMKDLCHSNRLYCSFERMVLFHFRYSLDGGIRVEILVDRSLVSMFVIDFVEEREIVDDRLLNWQFAP